MRRKVVINSEFSFLKDYIEEIPDRFDSLGHILYNSRNITREDQPQNIKVVVKSFRRIYLPNKIRYTYFYPSKAQRAFDYAKFLLNRGFNTPVPIAYIDVIDKGLITKSFFICLHTDFQPLKMVRELPFSERQELLREFAAFTYRLHNDGIFHGDYSVGNILYKKINDRFEFSLIDNNRTKFKTISAEDGIKSLEKLDLPVEYLAFIGKEYGILRNVHEAIAVERLFTFRRARLERGWLIKRSKLFVEKLSPIGRLLTGLRLGISLDIVSGFL